MVNPSIRAQVITRRTYNRPLDEAGVSFETWDQTVDRVVEHQTWLWERAQGHQLDLAQRAEMGVLRDLLLERKISVSGRTLWLGGTAIAKTREASQFNCSFARVETVHDVVDCMWLLLQGCGVGFEPVVGTLNGLAKSVLITTIRSTRKDKGDPNNCAFTYTDPNGLKVWRLRIGDSAEAWAKAVGKLLALKEPVDRIILDFSQVRPAGERLKGYGWISSGDETISKAFVEIVGILNRRAGRLLTRIDILDVMNWLGTTLSSRRSAEISLVPFGDPEWKQFALAKLNHFVDQPQRAQSNNSLLFYDKPTREELTGIFDMMVAAGGSEPGFINAKTALKRAPWFKGVNPCAEILLGNKSFCNLVEVDLGKFNGDFDGLLFAIWIAARANYRQTCVNLDDGVLQRSWHELNQFLRLCGVGLTGIVRWDLGWCAAAFEDLRDQAQAGVNQMADELGLPRPKNVTTVKPSGTLSKIMDTTEGVHKPLGKYIFNNVNFSIHDKNVEILREAGYRVVPNPYDATGVLVTFPVSWDDVEFDRYHKKSGKVWRKGLLGEDLLDPQDLIEVNLETAVEQLERYKLLMEHYVDHNCSITVSYEQDEIPAIIDWVLENWDTYVGVSFLPRADPTKTAADLGYPYLPQEVVTREAYEAYVVGLKPVSLEAISSLDAPQEDGCVGGVCPIR